MHDCLWEVMKKRQKVAGTQYGMELKVRILKDAANGMRFLHERARSVIHRDLKAKNILIDIRGTAKVSRSYACILLVACLTLGPAQVADFGISQNQTQSHFHARNEAGTRHYMAPELLSNAVYNEKVRPSEGLRRQHR